MKRNRGASIVEMLVSMSILVIVLGMATAGVVTALRVHRTQEAVTASQTKLRRVNEAVSQEIRGNVLGGLTKSPYEATSSSVSFTVIDGGVGYEVTNTTESRVTFTAAEENVAELDFGTGKALLVDSNGLARILDITGNVTSPSQNEFRLNHNRCDDIFSAANSLLFKVSTVGFDYDSENGTLYQQTDDENQLELAFGLTDFTIRYVYQNSDGSTNTELNPYTDGNNNPLRAWTDTSGVTHTLVRLELQLSTEAPVSGNKTIARSYSGQIELVRSEDSNQNRVIQGVSPCN